MITTETMLHAIDEYIYDCETYMNYFSYKDARFKHMSYSVWAAEQLKKYLHKNPGVKVYVVVNLFAHRMREYACMSNIRGEGSSLFSVAEEVAEYFLNDVVLGD